MDNQNLTSNLKLNLQAKAYQPKNTQMNQQQQQPQSNNPYMGHEMSNMYGGMYYGNMNCYNQNMNQPFAYQQYQHQIHEEGDNLNYKQRDLNENGQFRGMKPMYYGDANNQMQGQQIQNQTGMSNQSNPSCIPKQINEQVSQSGKKENIIHQKHPPLKQSSQTNKILQKSQQQHQNKVESTSNQSNSKNQTQHHNSRQNKIENVNQNIMNSTESSSEKGFQDLNKIDLVKDSFEGTMIEVDTKRQPVSLVFVGHVDAGKSTISGSLLYRLGQIDERTIEKYQREAKVHNRESWFIAYIMDVNEEERERGKTIEIGKAFFETPTKRFTLLDAPGHSGYIPNLLQGACQADFAGLVISAKQGEFEAGFEKTGSTREHVLLLRALGVNTLIVVINKMDEETVKWSKERYDQIKKDLQPFLKSCGYNLDNNVFWIPMSGLTSENLIKKVDSHRCPWYQGPTLIELLDSLDTPKRNENGPVRLSVLDRYRENSLYIMGKLENGIIKYGDTLTLMPNKTKLEVGWLFNSEEQNVPYAKPGETVRIRCKGLENESEVNRGNILCSNDDLCPIFNIFEAEIQVLDLPEQQIIANGFKCILHLHTFIEECTIEIKCEIDRVNKIEKKVKFVRNQSRIKAYVKTNNVLCGEKYENHPSLGRFSMRYEGLTIAIGKILKYKPF